MRIQHKKRFNLILVISTITILLLGGYVAFAFNNHLWPFPSKEAIELKEIEEKIDYSPPTEYEIENSQEGKRNSADSDTPQPSDTIEPKNAPVEISFAAKTENGTIDVRAFTLGVIEGTGTCTATFTKGSESVVETSNGFIDATSTICEPITIPATKFSSGTWGLIVTYKSPTSSGSSPEVEVNI